ncbi:MAG: protein YgfX [Candidatus Symbiodolus clandestinus]
MTTIVETKPLWEAQLRYSRFSDLCWLTGYGSLALIVVFTIWPVIPWLITPLLLSAVGYEGLMNRRRLLAAIGPIRLRGDRTVFWQGHCWQLLATLSTPWGIWLRLTHEQREIRLWIAIDGLTIAEWRALCRVVRTVLKDQKTAAEKG